MCSKLFLLRRLSKSVIPDSRGLQVLPGVLFDSDLRFRSFKVAYPNPMENRTMDQGIVNREEELADKERRERIKEWGEEQKCARRISDTLYDGHHSKNESRSCETRPMVEELIIKLEAKNKQQRVKTLWGEITLGLSVSNHSG
ncbi:hypothetical protein DFH07DRAFT_938467 [Mycena maculata]|uniref:Uncharacterized protein n=1 Tax=Mycena maculata TaxID=230809 RepID=A0AAD7JMN0_9AGAR|nr:hypothetical protein DFH07DRAFT_938467 [Mycena maculata]